MRFSITNILYSREFHLALVLSIFGLFVFFHTNKANCQMCFWQRVCLILYLIFLLLHFGTKKIFCKYIAKKGMRISSFIGAFIAFLQIANEFFWRAKYWENPRLPGGNLYWLLSYIPSFSFGLFVFLCCFTGYVLKKENRKWQ